MLRQGQNERRSACLSLSRRTLDHGATEGVPVLDELDGLVKPWTALVTVMGSNPDRAFSF